MQQTTTGQYESLPRPYPGGGMLQFPNFLLEIKITLMIIVLWSSRRFNYKNFWELNPVNISPIPT